VLVSDLASKEKEKKNKKKRVFHQNPGEEKSTHAGEGIPEREKDPNSAAECNLLLEEKG